MPTEKQRQKKSPDREATVALARETLTRRRALTPQILGFLLAHHEVTGDNVASWLRDHLEDLESYEFDLLLSPLFTPDFAMRVRFEDALGDGCLDKSSVDALIQELASEELPMVLLHEEERIETTLPEVMIERFVHMLHLDAPVPEEALLPEGTFAPLAPEVRCCLRDRAWTRPQSRALLPDLLAAARSIGEQFPGEQPPGEHLSDYVYFLTDFVRSHRPAGLEECLRFLDNVAEAYNKDLRKHESGSRSFFNDELKASYAGKWKVDEDVVAMHKRMISMARSLKSALS